MRASQRGCVVAIGESFRAKAMAQRLQWPCLIGQADMDVQAWFSADRRLEVILAVGPERLQLYHRLMTTSPVTVQRCAAGLVRRLRAPVSVRRESLARAVGLTRRRELTVFDVTAGWGRDGLLLAGLGATVVLMEREPLLVMMIEECLRCLDDQPFGSLIRSRVEVICGNSVELMRPFAEERKPAVIYLDPMFPPRKKSAKVKKEMQLLHYLAGEDQDAGAMLVAALACAPRVVVKRPAHAPCLGAHRPQAAIRGGQVRYDVYHAS